MITLRQDQMELVEAARDAMKGAQSVLARAPCGAGKCLGKDTPILMFDGKIKLVQNIVVGDKIMGHDSDPRIVTSICSGSEMLYRVTPKKGDPYIVNESHILSLKMQPQNKLGYKPREIVNIDVLSWIKKSKTFKATARGWRVGVNFSEPMEPCLVDPYFLGVWLGDGNSRLPTITSGSLQIVDYIYNYAKKLRLSVRAEDGSGCKNYHIVSGIENWGVGSNCLRNALKKYNLIKNKHIPHRYKVGTRSERLSILAGLIDTDGYYDNRGYDIVLVNKNLANDLVFIARSLGLAAYIKPCKKTCCNNGVIGDYYRIYISGNIDEIPCLIPEKKAKKRIINKDALAVGINVQPIGIGDYYGFEITGNDRIFLLGDFTATHNTVISGYISHQIALRGKRLIFTVHRRHLLRQTALTFQKFGIDFGVIAGAARNQNPHANVQIAMMDTLRNRLEQYDADLVIADECHLSASAGHRKVLDHYRAKGSRLLGLSASPKRLDGKPLGDIYDALVFGRDERWMIDNGILSDYRLIAPVNPALDGVGQNMGDYDKATLARVMDTPDIAGDAIANWRQYADGKRTIGYCVNIAHSQHTTAAFCAAGIAAEHVDGETPDDELRATIDRFASGQTKILFNCMLMVEGFDLSAQVGHDVPIEALIKLRPTCSTALDVQMNGRALRRKPEPAIILDHAANWEKHGLPCWERDWSLDGKAKSNRGMNIPIRCCAKCLRPYKPAPSCPYCGAVPIIKTRQIEHDERVALAEIDKERAHQARKAARKEEGRAKTLEELIELGKQRGYAPGWAIIRWKSRGEGSGSGGSAGDKNA